jgi:hypothetical protein
MAGATAPPFLGVLIMTIREIIQSQPLSEIISGIAMVVVLPIAFIALMVVLP